MNIVYTENTKGYTMIKEDVKIKNNPIRFVTRICDQCKKQDKTRMSTIVRGRKRRNKKVDLCKKCSHLSRYKYTIFGNKLEKSVHWRGGTRINNGYKQIYQGNGKYRTEQRIIMESVLGRRLKKHEKIHHIDMDKQNNTVFNLYLCAGRSEHMRCHSSMEECGFQLFESSIWFDRKTYQYLLTNNSSFYPNTSVIDRLLSKKTNIQIQKKKFENISYRRLTYRYLHRIIAEEMINRKLYADEVVHHINGDTLNNNAYNLCVMTRSNHNICHRSLQHCVGELYKLKKVKFSNGIYSKGDLK